MKGLKVVTIVGTRPEIIRMSRIIPALDKYFEHILVHTGQNHDHELSDIFFNDLGIMKPTYFLDCAKKSMSPGNTIGNLIIKVDHLLEKLQPDALVILGDTNSCLSSIPAKRRKIPIFHLEAGNRSFDQRVPEEINRKIVDHISDINLTYSSISREYLLREGFPPDQIIKIGSPMLEVLQYYLPKIKKSNITKKLGIKDKKYFVFSIHRDENVENIQNFKSVINIINCVAEKYNQPIILSTHPRTKNQLDKDNAKLHSLVKLLKPFGFLDYIQLQIKARVVLSDSGTISEESSILGFPALNIREAHERPEAMEKASVIMTGLKSNRVIEAISILEKDKKIENKILTKVPDYEEQNVSEKVARIILSYRDYIIRNVWKNFY
tara:strand:+ start:154 stop:1293 length:1140 start_codon:yes stop_codon:yes gene_type:complete